nr:MAG TPA: hypothetical protein [Bacteriophage sp.]
MGVSYSPISRREIILHYISKEINRLYRFKNRRLKYVSRYI